MPRPENTLHTPVRGGTPTLLKYQCLGSSLSKGGNPSTYRMRIPFQGFRCTGRGPSLGQQPDGVPSFPLPGRGRQNKSPVKIPGIHPPLFEKPVYLAHTITTPSQTPYRAIPVPLQIYPHFCTFHLGLSLGGSVS